MALGDIFKKQAPEKKEKKIEPEKSVKKAKKEEKQTSKQPAKQAGGIAPIRKEKKFSGDASLILKSPHVTEKAAESAERNQYIFKTYPRANKLEIKRAVENIFGVQVDSVRIINVPSRKRRVGRIEGVKSGYKKAIVKVKEGQKIEVMPR